MVKEENSMEFRTRVNGTTLAKLNGQPVVLLGSVQEVDSSGKSVRVKTSDEQLIIVKFNEPLQENVEGLVEFHGVSQGKQMIANFYINFPDDYSAQFDMDTYDQAIKVIHSMGNNPWCQD